MSFILILQLVVTAATAMLYKPLVLAYRGLYLSYWRI